jgi:hypothetical protein
MDDKEAASRNLERDRLNRQEKKAAIRASEIAAETAVEPQATIWPTNNIVAEANFDEECVMEGDLEEPYKVGHVHMRLNRAHIRHHEGPEFETMSPFVTVGLSCGGFEWKSNVKEGAGRNPEWSELAEFDFPLNEE